MEESVSRSFHIEQGGAREGLEAEEPKFVDSTPTPPPYASELEDDPMMLEIRDDVIWAKHLKQSPDLYNTIIALGESQTIRLSVGGIVGTWARMKDGKDGRPTLGIKPVGAMANVWKRMQSRRGERIALTLPETPVDPWLAMADKTFEEWYSAEDEEAFGDL